jgi:very-short-patch-repair endonuclease
MKQHVARLRDHVHRMPHNQTDAERKLWMLLRARQLCVAKFRRWHRIGPFITDFRSNITYIEVDGGQHAEERQADRKRSAFLERRGYHGIAFLG